MKAGGPGRTGASLSCLPHLKRWERSLFHSRHRFLATTHRDPNPFVNVFIQLGSPPAFTSGFFLLYARERSQDGVVQRGCCVEARRRVPSSVCRRRTKTQTNLQVSGGTQLKLRPAAEGPRGTQRGFLCEAATLCLQLKALGTMKAPLVSASIGSGSVSSALVSGSGASAGFGCPLAADGRSAPPLPSGPAGRALIRFSRAPKQFRECPTRSEIACFQSFKPGSSGAKSHVTIVRHVTSAWTLKGSGGLCSCTW